MTKVKVDRGHILIDQWGATDEVGIYAIGDVTGPPCIKPAMKALSVSKKSPVKKMFCYWRGAVPGCTYCRPQVASVGMTEAAAAGWP